MNQGFTVWLTGLSGAGKSTIAELLGPELTARGRKVEVLDGDEVRTHLSKGLGFSREDRDANVRRVGFVARLLARNGVIVLVPVIAPYAAARAVVRAEHESDGSVFVEVHVATPLQVCTERDVKGLYKKALAGEIPHFTGISDPYEPPAAPAVTIDSSNDSLEDSLASILSVLEARGIIAPQRESVPSGAGT